MSDTQNTEATEGAATIEQAGAAPDARTAAAGKKAAADKAAGMTEAQVVDAAQAERDRAAAARAKIKPKHYKAVFGLMIDPDTLKEFGTENATKSGMTAWLEFQIANGKIVEDSDE